MALKPCKECGKEVSTKAKTCPHCGIKNPGVTTKDMVIGMLGIGAIAVIAIAFLSGDDEPSTIVSSANVNPWPLAVDSAKIECFYSPKVVFSVGEKLYGLTGAASRNPLPDYEQMSIDTEIWLDNPDIPGTKISVSKFIEKGRALCE